VISRRRFTQALAMTAAATGAAACGPQTGPQSAPQTAPPGLRAGSGKNTSLGPIKQIQAGVLNVGYAEFGPATGRPVVLLHGWPYDAASYVDVGPLLAQAGYRVIVPYLRGYGPTTFSSPGTTRTGQQAATAVDTMALLDALGIEKAIFAGYDWGSRTVAAVAALWPQRCIALVPVSGYLIVNLEANQKPLPPAAELGWWYQYYFATDRGVRGYTENRHDFNKLIWQKASPKWNFDDATYDRSAASFNNPDHVAVVIHNYRWRLSLASSAPEYDGYERQLAASPPIAVPTITIASDFDGAAANGAGYRAKFTGKYQHRVFDGIGHNVPQEAPEAFARAVIDADHL
jgi:pimeloyl-ACP methyl ester carboxylesterase